MERLDPSSYGKILNIMDNDPCGAVYTKSIAEKIQYGDIYTYKDSVLIWHYSGFAFVYGECDNGFLESVYREFLNAQDKLPRRFILFVSDYAAESFFRQKKDLLFGRRFYFIYPGSGISVDAKVPENYSVCEFSEELYETVQGRVTPRTFWRSAAEFLENGKGYCIMHEGKAAAWAFSAAVSSREIDIGIETMPEHRNLGLAKLAAGRMIGYSLSQNKRPVWACDAKNAASYNLALRSGFEKTAECVTIRADVK